MTICIVGICDNEKGKAAVAIADRMVTAGDTEFEQAAFSKITTLTANCVALSAGSALVPTELFNATKAKFSGIPAPSIFEIVQEIKRNFVRLRTIRAEEKYFRPLGLSVKEFLENQRALDNTLVIRLTRYLEEARLGGQAGLQILVAGIDSTGSHIYCIEDPGSSECFDSIGYCSIGSGERHADSTLIVNGYHIAMPFKAALYLMYEAKKRAEIAPGVGRMYTDVTIVDETGIQNLNQVQLNALQEVYDKSTGIEKKCRAEQEILIQGIAIIGSKKK